MEPSLAGDSKPNLPLWAPWAAFAAFMMLLVTRYPMAVTGAPFVSDDGKLFEMAWNQGVSSLWTPYHGYLNLLPGLVSLGTMPLVLDAAAGVFAWTALLIHAAVAAALLSRRAAEALPSSWARLALATGLAVYPSYVGILGNLAHAQWFLAVWGLVVVLTPRPPGFKTRVWDALYLLLLGLSGPFAILVLPFALSKIRERGWALMVLAPCSALQLFFVFTGERLDAPGNHKAATLVGMIAKKVWDAVTAYPTAGGYSVTLDPIELLKTVITIAFLAYLAKKGPLLIRGLAILAIICFLLALRSGATWYGLGTPGQGERYFFLMGLCLVGGFATLAEMKSSRVVQALGLLCLALFAASVVRGWVPERFAKPSYEAAYRRARVGRVSIPIAPDGGPWSMNLEKPRP
ncbi:MAG: hypothetical protein HZC36_09585 [Armatimonadetes bacterium]|nr:hypothetical protein [Armatimonadota bacterium]